MNLANLSENYIEVVAMVLFGIGFSLLLFNRNLIKKMGKQARINAESHSSKYFAERVLDVYNIAIKNKRKSIIPFIDKLRKKYKNEDNNFES